MSVPAPALGDRGAVDQFNRTTSLDIPREGRNVLVVEKSLDLAAGEARHLRGRLEAVSSTTGTVAMNATLICNDQAGTKVGSSATSSRNHEGSDASYKDTGHLPLYVDMLFVAPAAGTYLCGLYGLTDVSNATDYHLAVVTGGKTWLQVSAEDQPGANWWRGPACSSSGDSVSCTYLGTSAKADTFVFYNDGSTPVKWRHAPGATAVQALANVTVTTCYKGTKSCAGVPESERLARTATSSSSVSFRMDVIQLDAAGSHTCRLTQTTPVTNKISDEAHHYVTYLSLPSVPVDSSCGDQFLLRVYVKHLSGSPIKIDGQQSTSLTNGIMMNL
ncbi:hypothetical protein [Actinoplanes regularis]|uniref:hypothetical protein n=1 Tax=Actinoplanes regularis TaxID=52697 RepID=UPI0024A3DE66|nr:hypothetical protein [Actinoplanes regularis]GLW33127.1 hypothetical protein Areg01_60650 [Actinoplanes regularis]